MLYVVCREARQKESMERLPRTRGALYRRVVKALDDSSATSVGAVSGDESAEFVNADVPQGYPDPLQVGGMLCTLGAECVLLLLLHTCSAKCNRWGQGLGFLDQG